jgi:hypothetical protein
VVPRRTVSSTKFIGTTPDGHLDLTQLNFNHFTSSDGLNAFNPDIQVLIYDTKISDAKYEPVEVTNRKELKLAISSLFGQLAPGKNILQFRLASSISS